MRSHLVDSGPRARTLASLALRVWTAGFILAAGHPPPAAAFLSESSPVALEPGVRVERPLAPGETHRYEVTLAAGEFLHITIAQRGIDLKATLAAPDGAELVTVDVFDEPFRTETLVAIADRGGSYLVSLKASGAAPAAGRYA
ncbi:MAG TPA: PPC domain-containing protein, partial [Vicinamibacterales bacterium]|nr:PPC domain-containing protein [Vicinamibacterales bacterium]